MEIQLSRLEMFEKIERLQRDLADGAWEHVDLSHSFNSLRARHNAYREFIRSNALDVTIGMASGADANTHSAMLLAKILRQEFKKIDEQCYERE